MAKIKQLELFLDATTDYSIRDLDDRVYTIEEARELWNAGKVKNYNLSFFRLARNQFDIEATKRYYELGGRA